MKRSLVCLICVLLYLTCSTLAVPMQKCKKVVDIAMILDESGSIGSRGFRDIKKFVGDVISRFSVEPFGAHFAAVKYSSIAREVFSLTKYTDAAKLQTAVKNIKYVGGGTYTGRALEMVQKQIFGRQDDRKDVPNIVVLFSDGQSHDQSKAVRVAREMRDKGVEILCVGIGNGKTVSRLITQLKQISSKPEYTFKITVNAMNTIEDSLVKDMCEAASACVSNPCKNGGQCIEDSNGGYQCKCSPNWEGKNCELPKSQKCKKVVDIAMILDESGSIGSKGFQDIKKFVGDVISRFSVEPFGAHFAAVKYSSIARKVFSLTKYTDAAKLQTAVKNIKYIGGSTYTGRALEMVQKQIFGTQDDRKDVPNIVVLFSDGESHDQSKAVRVAREMRDKGVEILCVGIGNGKTVIRLIKQLKQISSKPEYTFNITVNAMNTIEDSLVKDMCEAASACVSNPCKNGGQCVDDSNGGYQCKCSPNWEGKNCEFPKWCLAATFSKLGCYKTPRPRPAKSKLLFNRRNAIDWNAGWDGYLEKIVCDCGKAAKDEGYKYFCIEFYGECWGYNDFNVNQPHAGAKACWGKRPNYDTCIHDQRSPVCVGTARHGYFYQLN